MTNDSAETPQRSDEPLHSFSVRLRRADTWMERAETAREADDPDLAFLLYWIAFNAAYARDISRDFSDERLSERGAFEKFLETLLSLDEDRAIEAALWGDLRDTVTSLFANEYLFGPFWDSTHGQRGTGRWKTRFTDVQRQLEFELRERNTKKILITLFRRLYTLRNQLVHGGARWRSSFNRDSVRNSARVMDRLVPILVDLMRANPQKCWGVPMYPPGLKSGRFRESLPAPLPDSP